MVTFSLILLLAAGDAAPASASAQAKLVRLDLPAVVARVQSRYDQAKDFQAHFTQNYSRSVVGRVTVSAGQVHFKKPGRMRWDYDKPEARMFLSNGQFLWLYEPSEKQAFKQDLEDIAVTGSPGLPLGQGQNR